MAMPPTSPPFKSRLGVLDTMGQSFRVYFSNINPLIIIVALFLVPLNILMTLVLRLTIPDELMNLEPSADLSGLEFEDFAGLIAASVGAGLLAFFASMIAIGACFRLVESALTGEALGWRESIRIALGKAKALLWLPILEMLLFMGAGIVAVVVIGLMSQVAEPLAALGIFAAFGAMIYYFVLWSLAMPALMAEDTRGSRALVRSKELISGNWWPVFGTYVLTFLIFVIVGGILSAIFGSSTESLDNENLVLYTLENIVVNVIVTPFQAALAGVIFFRLRTASPAGPAPGSVGGPPLPPPPSSGA